MFASKVSKINSQLTGSEQVIARYLLDKYGEQCEDPANGTIFISHADSAEDAATLADMFKEKYGVEVEHMTDIGTVVGAHAGPGTIALFYIGTAR